MRKNYQLWYKWHSLILLKLYFPSFVLSCETPLIWGSSFASKSAQGQGQLEWGRTGVICWRSACWLWQGQRPRRPAGRSNSAVGWRRKLKGWFTRCNSCGISMPSRRNGGFYSLTRAMHSMSRTTHSFCGRCTTSGPVVRGLNLTDIATGPHWWSGQETVRVNYYTVRRGWPMEIHWR